MHPGRTGGERPFMNDLGFGNVRADGLQMDSSSNRRRPRRRRVPAAFRLWVVLIGVAASGCMAQAVVVVGEAPLPSASPVPMVKLLVTDDDGVPLDGARVMTGDARIATDDAGLVGVRWEGEQISISVEATGFFPGAVAVDEFQEEPLELVLRPVVLRGAVLDAGGFGLPGASVSLGGNEVVTDRSGRFEIRRAVAGNITVSRPGWQSAEFAWDGEMLVTEIEIQPRFIRGLHVAFSAFIDREKWRELLTVAEETVVNALVIDAKDESGRVFYETGVGLANRIGAVDPLFDMDRVVTEMDSRGLYKIARIVAFQDPIAARAEVDMAVFDTATGGPFRKGNQYFLDPTDRRARAYALDLAEEVCGAGFDEVQFDYVRFPDGYPDSAVFDLGDTEEVRVQAIAGFLQEAADRLHPLGCVVAADIFGFITSVVGDGGIGQEIGALSTSVDVLSPMVYPSHYSKGWFGFDKPNDHPGAVVGQALDAGLERLEGPAVVRPWLQDFYYDPSQVREEIEAAEARSLGWMLWNARSRFQTDALDAARPISDAPTGEGNAGTAAGPDSPDPSGQ